MKQFLSLLKINLNLNFGISAFKYRFTREKKRRWETIGIGLSAFIGVGMLIVLYCILVYGFYTGAMLIKHPEMVLTVSFLFGQLIVLFFGIFYLMSSFYFSKDLNALITLPLKPYAVLGGKFAVVMINEYLTLIPILLPCIIIFGVGTGQGFLYWIKGIVLVLVSPVVPLAIGAVFVLLLMRFVNIRRSKDLLAILGGFLGIFIALGVNFFVQRIPKGTETEYIKNIIASKSGLIESMGRSFPPSKWATYSLSEPGIAGLGYLLLFVGVSALLFIVLLWLGNRVFYRGLLAGQEVARRKKSLTGEQIERHYSKGSSPVWAVFLKEWKLLLRTPVYVLNGLTGAIMGPFMVIFAFFAQGQAGKSGDILTFMQKPEFVSYVSLGGLALMLFTAGMNIVACTTISREGQTFWISKVIPVPVHLQVLAKYMHGMSISVLGVLTTGIVMVVFLKLSIPRVILLAALGILGSVLLVALNIMIDVLHPKLVWNSPQEAVKTNLNSMFGMLVTLLVMIVLGALSVFFIIRGLPEWAIYASLAGIMAVLSIPSIVGLFRLAEKQYGRIEL